MAEGKNTATSGNASPAVSQSAKMQAARAARKPRVGPELSPIQKWQIQQLRGARKGLELLLKLADQGSDVSAEVIDACGTINGALSRTMADA